MSVSGISEVMERVTFLLRCRRGGFPLLPDLGSRLYLLPFEKRQNVESAALQYITEALEKEKEVAVRAVSAAFEDDRIRLIVTLSYRGTNAEIALTV